MSKIKRFIRNYWQLGAVIIVIIAVIKFNAQAWGYSSLAGAGATLGTLVVVVGAVMILITLDNKKNGG